MQPLTRPSCRLRYRTALQKERTQLQNHYWKRVRWKWQLVCLVHSRKRNKQFRYLIILLNVAFKICEQIQKSECCRHLNRRFAFSPQLDHSPDVPGPALLLGVFTSLVPSIKQGKICCPNVQRPNFCPFPTTSLRVAGFFRVCGHSIYISTD